jgi:hypothetical protein
MKAESQEHITPSINGLMVLCVPGHSIATYEEAAITGL